MSHGFSQLPASSSLPTLVPLVGSSPAMHELFRLIERVAPTEADVLRVAVERAFILGDRGNDEPPLNRERLDIRVGSRIDDVERSLIEATLDYFKGNKRRAADVLGCSLKTLYNKLNGYSQSQQLANT